MSQEPVKLVIIVEGGMIQDVLTCGVPIEVAVVDYDADNCGGSEDDIDVPQGDGTTERAMTSMWAVGDHAPERALELFNLVKENVRE